jgi:hypothetical protein
MGGEIAAAIYLAGVVVGLMVMRDRWAVRIGTALVWPIGVLSLLVVTVILLTAAMYLWPVLALAVLALIAIGVLLL